MSGFTLTDQSALQDTQIPNIFIDRYMLSANGEFVKVYLYLLRLRGLNTENLSLRSIADVFACPESDILRALRYWEKEHVLALSMQDQEVRGITLLSLSKDANQTKISSEKPVEKTASKPVSTRSAVSNEHYSISNSKLNKMKKENEQVSQLIFCAEQYLGRTLSTTDVGRILYFYEILQFPVSLLEYLIEYCVGHGSTSLHYIEAVGLEWHRKGIRSVTDAKEQASSWKKEYYAILKAFGIRNRNPLPNEITYMDTWLDQYGFSLELIEEACARTVGQTGQASFQYTEGILSSWKKKQVHSMKDVKALDEAHKARKRPEKEGSQTESPGNRFNNFHQRSYNYSELEQQLLESQRADHKGANTCP